jgi:hypothetical protein
MSSSADGRARLDQYRHCHRAASRAASQHEEDGVVAYAIIVDSPATLEQHRALITRLGDDPSGAIARFAGEIEGGLRVISVWESKADSDRFFAERLGPMLAQMLGPARVQHPQVSELDVQEWWVASHGVTAGQDAAAG